MLLLGILPDSTLQNAAELPSAVAASRWDQQTNSPQTSTLALAHPPVCPRCPFALAPAPSFAIGSGDTNGTGNGNGVNTYRTSARPGARHRHAAHNGKYVTVADAARQARECVILVGVGLLRIYFGLREALQPSSSLCPVLDEDFSGAHFNFTSTSSPHRL
ncbi:hypothetical protein C8J57DRAFT_1711660 [Mycena rebaudengoi]|nr:hypothetical protein C8J57DRAFT_1711660 [Mycena rebaudengoi]